MDFLKNLLFKDVDLKKKIADGRGLFKNCFLKGPGVFKNFLLKDVDIFKEFFAERL